ncbi:unnamed protein product [Lupinus luteus]|uniref:Uncharacterized protein n=1 Tax=Lupinus luteus TaxID=3873 RepID=A0AAV1WY05_LUPLU
MWLKHDDCRKLVQESWRNQVYVCPMFILGQKLKRLKSAFRTWNTEVFGNIHTRVKNSLAVVDVIQNCINENGPEQELFDREVLAQNQLLSDLVMEEDFWKEKSRLNWHISWDRNTNFFHKVTKIRQVTKTMSLLKVGDEIMTSQSDIANHVLDY